MVIGCNDMCSSKSTEEVVRYRLMEPRFICLNCRENILYGNNLGGLNSSVIQDAYPIDWTDSVELELVDVHI